MSAIELALECLLGRVLADCPDDDAAALLGQHRLDHLPKPLSLGPVADLAADPDARGIGHVYEEPSGERDLGRDARSLGRDRLFGDLDEDLLSPVDEILDRRRLAAPVVAVAAGSPARRPSAAPSPVATAALTAAGVGVGRISLRHRPPLGGVTFLVFVLFVVFAPAPDPRRGGMHSFRFRCRRTLPECPAVPLRPCRVNVADHAAGFGAVYEQLNQLVVLHNGDPRLARIRVDHNLAFH